MVKRVIALLFLSLTHLIRIHKVESNNSVIVKGAVPNVESHVVPATPAVTKALLSSQYPNENSTVYTYLVLSLLVMGITAFFKLKHVRSLTSSRDLKIVMMLLVNTGSVVIGSFITGSIVDLLKTKNSLPSHDLVREIYAFPIGLAIIYSLVYAAYLGMIKIDLFSSRLPVISGNEFIMKFAYFTSIIIATKLSLDTGKKLFTISNEEIVNHDNPLEDIMHATAANSPATKKYATISPKKVYTKSWRLLLPFSILLMYLALEYLDGAFYINYRRNITIIILSSLEIVISYLLNLLLTQPKTKNKVQSQFYLEETTIYSVIYLTVTGLTTLTLLFIFPFFEYFPDIEKEAWLSYHLLALLVTNIGESLLELFRRKQKKLINLAPGLSNIP